MKFAGELNWEITWFLTSQYTIDIGCGAPEQVGTIDAVGRQRSNLNIFTKCKDCGQTVAVAEPSHQRALSRHHRTRRHNHSAVRLTRERNEVSLELFIGFYLLRPPKW